MVPKERADTILVGSIENVHVRTLSLDAAWERSFPRSSYWSSMSTSPGRTCARARSCASGRDFEQTAPYYPTLGETQFLAQQQSVEILALAIVHELQADW